MSQIEKTTQYSVFMINKPGVLQQVCSELGSAKINIIALTMMDSMEHGVLRIVSDESSRTREVIRKLGIPISETDVILVPMPNNPGAMADICTRLAEAKCKVSYAYCTSGTRGGRTIGVFKVGNISKAIQTLASPQPKRRKLAKLRNPVQARRT